MAKQVLRKKRAKETDNRSSRRKKKKAVGNIESNFLTELLVSKDFTKIADEGITPKFFSGSYKEIFKYILKHQNDYGGIPQASTIKKKFPNIELGDAFESTGEPLSFWCDELRNKNRHNLLVEAIEQAGEYLSNLSTEKAYTIIRKAIDLSDGSLIKSDRVKINENTKARYEAYKERQGCGGITGLPTGIDLFDAITGGLQDGELITFMAYTGVGKTWLEVIIAVHLAKLGYKVLFMTTEMTAKSVFNRIDAVWNGFNYSEFKKGQMSSKDEKKYIKYLEKMEKKSDDDICFVVEQASQGVSQISAKIEQYKPDIVLIDGAYLLEDDMSQDDDWKSTLRIWRQLHKLCIAKNLPIVVNTQSKEETGAKLGSLSFAKALSNECDIVAVLEQDEQQRRDREADLRLLKFREGDNLSTIYMDWDFNSMKHNSIYQERNSEQQEEQEDDTKISIA